MNKFFVLALCLLVQQFSFGQCDKKVVFTCDKVTEVKNGALGQEMPMQATITLGKGSMVMVVTVNGEEEKVQGTITEILDCNWARFMEEGSSRYKVSAAKEGQLPSDGIFEVERRGGTATITMGDPSGSSKMLFAVHSYEIEEPEPVQPAEPEQKKTKKKKKKA